MRKNTLRGWIVWAVLLVVYNVAAFTIPFPKIPVFYVSWAFTLIAIGVQIYVFHAAFGKGETVKSKFYRFPIARLGVLYLVAQLLLGSVFMALADRVAAWMPLIVYAVLLGVAVVGLVAVDTARDEMERQDIKVHADTACMRSLQARTASFPNRATDPELRRELTKLAEAVRFSDPVSQVALHDVETELTACIDALERAVAEHDNAVISDCIEKTMTALETRNYRCKQGKQ